LHVALATKKPWDAFLQVLLDGTTMGSERMTTSQGQLPLHLAIQHYPSRAKEIHELCNRYPDATTAVDGKERLFTFQLAAVVKGKSQSKSKSERKQKKSELSNNNRHKHNKERLSTTDARPETKNLDQESDIFFFFSLLF
jgi:cyclophilin family peptidyl-prolyl cis-trans isomerase